MRRLDFSHHPRRATLAGGRVASPGVFLATIGLLVATRISCGRQDTYVRISPGVGNGTPHDAGADSSGGATTVGGGAGSTAVAPGGSPVSGVGGTAGDTPQMGGTGGEAIAPATVGAAGGSLAIGEPDHLDLGFAGSRRGGDVRCLSLRHGQHSDERGGTRVGL